MNRKLIVAVVGAWLSTAALALAADESFNAALCADSYDKALVRDYYERRHPGDPPPVPGRAIDLVETKVVSALTASEAIGAVATPQRIDAVVSSLASWGAANVIGLVVTVDGWHAYNFPSTVPLLKKNSNGLYDLFADNGRGVRGYIDPAQVSFVYAFKLPKSATETLRGVSFYGPEGDLIVGLYATEPGKPENAQVIAGFDTTWSAIATMPRACRKPSVSQ